MGAYPRLDPKLKSLRWPLWLTRMGMIAETSLRAFWPLASVVMLALASLMLGLHDMLSVELVWSGAVVALLGAVIALVRGVRKLQWPSRAQAMARLDETLPGRPINALMDAQAIGGDDAASTQLWQAHQRRMAERAAKARAPQPNLRIAAADPYALRYVAMLALVVALLFGSIWRVGTVRDLGPGAASAMSGPTWEGWLQPPRYTGLPTLYLNDVNNANLELPQGSTVTLRFYGQAGSLTLAETVSGRTGELPSAADAQQEFTVNQAGDLAIEGVGGQSWQVEVIGDSPPQISVAGEPEIEPDGTMSLPFAAMDDYGVAGGEVRIALDMLAVDRRHGLAAAPDPRDEIVLDLPLPLSGDRRDFVEHLIDDFSQHPWANLPVTYTFEAHDAAEQKGETAGFGAPLLARRFFDPLAAAVVEQRRDLLWSRSNAGRIAQIMRTLTHKPEGQFRSPSAYLRMRMILRRLESYTAAGLTPEYQNEIAAALWDLALMLEDGDVGDALERLRRAQERLSQAMRDGASDQEIAELMQELREATEDYMRQLQRQAEANGEVMEQGQMPENMMQLSQDDLQAMMDRIQELMEQGRMAEAEQALRELQELMENMRVTESQQGQGGSEGQQAMEGLAETLKEQQGLSDQAFRDLQEQFNPGAGKGESEQNQGRNGGLGRGQNHEGGQGGDSQQGQQQGGSQEGQDGSSQSGQGQAGAQSPGDSLAERQQALREELQRQKNGLPLGSGEEGDATRQSLEDAGRAMEGAQEALEQGDFAEAIDQQAEAMERLREGMRALGEALAEQQQPGQAGSQSGRSTASQGSRMDPLGRDQPEGRNGTGDDGSRIGEGSAYRRAWDLLEEIRRRADEQERSEQERGYLQRLLDRF
ncbi:TIGR02302 family protein [Sedimentitalea sp. CY04]|uniref:TIGR02302 family protein n=1 Tax=Parasedimentitalea denitrificans TaxID=2211118 RepID=A0ABX0WEH1_9RHOB|nr:TIGR02302 family protein [Sedimentitalea sp. CY04]NIZ62700.1 TIGR02302 family protein [Sedimentitalea sp. CY04]